MKIPNKWKYRGKFYTYHSKYKKLRDAKTKVRRFHNEGVNAIWVPLPEGSTILTATSYGVYTRKRE